MNFIYLTKFYIRMYDLKEKSIVDSQLNEIQLEIYKLQISIMNY